MAKSKQINLPIPAQIGTGTVKLHPVQAHWLRMLGEWKNISIADLLAPVIQPFIEEEIPKLMRSMSGFYETEPAPSATSQSGE